MSQGILEARKNPKASKNDASNPEILNFLKIGLTALYVVLCCVIT